MQAVGLGVTPTPDDGTRRSSTRIWDESQRPTRAADEVTHAELERDGARIMLANPNAEYRGPRQHAETCEDARRWLDNPWVIDGVFVEVDDLDAHHAQAVAAGARRTGDAVLEPAHDRQGRPVHEDAGLRVR